SSRSNARSSERTASATRVSSPCDPPDSTEKRFHSAKEGHDRSDARYTRPDMAITVCARRRVAAPLAAVGAEETVRGDRRAKGAPQKPPGCDRLGRTVADARRPDRSRGLR